MADLRCMHVVTETVIASTDIVTGAIGTDREVVHLAKNEKAVDSEVIADAIDRY
jgi:hypothetical protein